MIISDITIRLGVALLTSNNIQYISTEGVESLVIRLGDTKSRLENRIK